MLSGGSAATAPKSGHLLEQVTPVQDGLARIDIDDGARPALLAVSEIQRATDNFGVDAGFHGAGRDRAALPPSREAACGSTGPAVAAA